MPCQMHRWQHKDNVISIISTRGLDNGEKILRIGVARRSFQGLKHGFGVSEVVSLKRSTGEVFYLLGTSRNINNRRQCVVLELVPLRSEKVPSHAHKTGACYLLWLLCKTFDEYLRPILRSDCPLTPKKKIIERDLDEFDPIIIQNGGEELHIFGSYFV